MRASGSGTWSAMSSFARARWAASRPDSGWGWRCWSVAGSRRGPARGRRTAPAREQRASGSVLELPAARGELVGALASMALARLAAG